jgi:hypothetical protein
LNQLVQELSRCRFQCPDGFALRKHSHFYTSPQLQPIKTSRIFRTELIYGFHAILGKFVFPNTINGDAVYCLSGTNLILKYYLQFKLGPNQKLNPLLWGGHQLSFQICSMTLFPVLACVGIVTACSKIQVPVFQQKLR